MNKVEPIRDMKKLKVMKEILHNANLRDYCCFVVGIECGLKINNLLQLDICDVVERNNKIRKKIRLTQEFTVNDSAAAALLEYLQIREPYSPLDPLFKSRKRKEGVAAAISRISVYRSINAAARAAGIVEQIGTESMRKTFGLLALERGESLAYVSKILHHSEKRQTLKYLGITEEQVIEFNHVGI